MKVYFLSEIKDSLLKYTGVMWAKTR